MNHKVIISSACLAVLLLLFWSLSQFTSVTIAQTNNATIWYVNAAAAGNSNGSSWADAFTDLQDALAAAQPGAEIWIAAGVYKPTGDGADREAAFQLLDGVALYGGFAGHESERDGRDWESNVTVLSGDIDNNDAADESGVVTDTVHIAGANSYHVVVGNGTDETAILDGFTLTAGQANGTAPGDRGGGMFNYNGKPTIANVTFSGNNAGDGGGMYNGGSGSRPTLTNVIFSGNSAADGGGMYNSDTIGTTLTNVTFRSNNASVGGGGMVSDNNSNPRLSNVTFSGNSAQLGGGGLFTVGNDTTILTNVTFSGNSADLGGGLLNTSNDNSVLTNVTFSGNSANSGGGMYNSMNSDSVIRNSIFWGNQHQSPLGTAAANIFNVGSFPTISHSLVQGSNGSGGSWNSDVGIDLGNNIDANPLFIDPPDADDAPGLTGNVRLRLGSPAIDAGNDSYVAGVVTDLDGNPRIFGSQVDLGAYETRFGVITVNVVGEGSVALNPYQAHYLYGDVITVTAAPNLGWTFTGWGGDMAGSDNPKVLTFDGDTVITATFVQDQYTITINLVGQGSVAAEPEQAVYLYGEMVELTAVADPRWAFTGWSGYLIADDNPIGLAFYGDISISATFEQIQFDLYLPLVLK
jgi:predicted outer membrane repeat protein